MQPTIELSGARPIISGAYRDVYQHPLDDDFLVKVIRKRAIERHARRAKWYAAWYGVGHYESFFREIEQYLVLRRRGQHELPFIQQFTGIVETDIGLGAVVRKVRGHDGGLAPTLAGVVRSRGMSEELTAMIGGLRDDVVREHIVFGDISVHNIVEADGGERGRHLVIIDGLNDRLWLPVNSLSRSINRMYCHRRFARMMKELEAIERGRANVADSRP